MVFFIIHSGLNCRLAYCLGRVIIRLNQYHCDLWLVHEHTIQINKLPQCAGNSQYNKVKFVGRCL